MPDSLSEQIAPAEFVELLREAFGRGQELTFTPSGRSMLPMLDGKEDKVTLSPKPDRLRKYDVALYIRRGTGQLVLHRMIGFDRGGGYIFCGDGQYVYEYGVTDDDILALMTAFTHGGKEHGAGDRGYRSYCRRMLLGKRIRNFLKRIRRIFNRKPK